MTPPGSTSEPPGPSGEKSSPPRGFALTLVSASGVPSPQVDFTTSHRACGFVGNTCVRNRCPARGGAAPGRPREANRGGESRAGGQRFTAGPAGSSRSPRGADDQPLFGHGGIIRPHGHAELMVAPHARVHREVQRHGRRPARFDGRQPDDRFGRSAAGDDSDAWGFRQAQRRVTGIRQRECGPRRCVKAPIAKVHLGPINHEPRRSRVRLLRRGTEPQDSSHRHDDGAREQRPPCPPSSSSGIPALPVSTHVGSPLSGVSRSLSFR